VTQLYETGAAIYFYLGFYMKGVSEPSEIFSEIEQAAREEILASGGSLSHHHGVGRIRARFLPDILSSAALEWRDGLKQAIDPEHLFVKSGSFPDEGSTRDERTEKPTAVCRDPSN
jgi:alkyldihydroxyacetonephosphate synthase